MDFSLSNSLVSTAVSNPDKLSLNLQFATDKTLTARKGPTPVFTRASAATYYGPLVDYGSLTAFISNSISSDRSEWAQNDGTQFIRIYYTSTRWVIEVTVGEDVTEYFAALGTEFRPEQANWSASGAPFTPTTSSTFGLVRAGTNEPRFDHNTTAPNACRGLLIEESRTNLLLNSNSLNTQTRTVTAGSHTLSFHGTGTIVLSGAAVATVTGTGAYPTRTTLTFTTTAGSLTLTRTGSVTQAQLELGAFATSYIPTTSASVVRSADVCSITGSDFTTVYNESEHTLFAEASGMSHANFGSYLSFDNGTSVEQSALAGFPSPNSVNCYEVDGNVTQAQVNKSITLNQNNKMAAGMKLNSFQVALNNTLGTEDTSGTMATATSLKIGRSFGGSTISGTYAQIKVFKKRLANAKLQALTV